jgi:thioredoxin-dependent peroxiredoxin
MKSYRDRYDEFAAKHAQILAVSADKQSRQAEFRREIGAPFAFIADPKGELLRLYGVKTPLVTFARRTTFVIGKGRKILHIDTGGDAVDVSGAAQACSLY